MVDGGGGGSIKAAPDVTDLKRYVSSCPLAQSGPRVENEKRKKNGKRSSEFGIKMYSICGLPCLDCKCAYIQSVPIGRNSLSNQELERRRSNICATNCNMVMTMRRMTMMMMAMMTMRWLMMRMMMMAMRWLMMRMMCSPAVLLQAVHWGDVVRRHLWV